MPPPNQAQLQARVKQIEHEKHVLITELSEIKNHTKNQKQSVEQEIELLKHKMEEYSTRVEEEKAELIRDNSQLRSRVRALEEAESHVQLLHRRLTETSRAMEQLLVC